MAFMLHSIDGSDRIPGLEYLPAASALVPKVGMPLKWNSGELTSCSATNAPEFICMTNNDTAVIPVIRVDKDMIFETTMDWGSTTIAAGAKPGAKVTIDTTNWGVTDTTTSGVAELVTVSATDGGLCRVRF